MSHGHPNAHRHHHAEDPFREADLPGRWEAWAHLFEPATAALTEAMLDAAHVTAGTRVLDAACGIGPTTAAAHARGARVLGIDLHPDMVARARRRHPDVRFEVGDMRDLPVQSGGWDAVLCRFGAHHVDDAAWLEHARSRLRPGGRVAIAEWGTGAEVPLHAALDKAGHVAVERPPSDWVAALVGRLPKRHAVQRGRRRALRRRGRLEAVPCRHARHGTGGGGPHPRVPRRRRAAQRRLRRVRHRLTRVMVSFDPLFPTRLK